MGAIGKYFVRMQKHELEISVRSEHLFFFDGFKLDVKIDVLWTQVHF